MRLRQFGARYLQVPSISDFWRSFTVDSYEDTLVVLAEPVPVELGAMRVLVLTNKGQVGWTWMEWLETVE